MLYYIGDILQSYEHSVFIYHAWLLFFQGAPIYSCLLLLLPIEVIGVNTLVIATGLETASTQSYLENLNKSHQKSYTIRLFHT